MGTKKRFDIDVAAFQAAYREELESAWLRGWRSRATIKVPVESKDVKQMAADYAERVVGGPTRPVKLDPLSTPSKDKNAAQGQRRGV